MLKYQRTLRDRIRLEGIGLHTGYPVHMTLVPAPQDTGIRFRRTDLRNFEIEATRAHVAKVSYATTLMKKGVMISTVEHLLSTLYGLGIDNLFIDLDSMEVPILDGSGLRFIEKIEDVGIREQGALRRYIVILEPIEVRQGDKVAGVYPAPVPTATYIIDFEYLKRCGLIRGGSLDNAVVLDDSGIVNADLRFPDEFVRHKLLDLLGDISLVGYPIVGHLYAEKAGHAIHAALADHVVRQQEKYRISTIADMRPVMATRTAG